MQYAKVVTPVREALVALELANWGAAYQKLFDQTNVSGAEVWAVYSHNNFKNPFQQADEQLYEDRGWWTEIFRDVVREGGRGADNKDRLDVNYVSHAGTEWEKSHNGIWAPKNGFYVPTDDGIFVPGTLIPFETVQNRKTAMERLKAKGIPPEQVSYFWRPNRYQEERFGGRGFCPSWAVGGRFCVDAGRLPSLSGDDGGASRPAYGTSEIVMEVRVPEIVKSR